MKRQNRKQKENSNALWIMLTTNQEGQLKGTYGGSMMHIYSRPDLSIH